MSSNPENKDPLNTDELNRAALDFQKCLITIKQRTRALPKKSMERVLDAVVEFPLGQKPPKFRNDFEQELFTLTLQALASKNVMIQAVIKNQAEIAEKLKESEQPVE